MTCSQNIIVINRAIFVTKVLEFEKDLGAWSDYTPQK